MVGQALPPANSWFEPAVGRRKRLPHPVLRSCQAVVVWRGV